MLNPKSEIQNAKSEIVAHIRFIGDYAKANFLSAMEYRVSFLTQVFGMVINDAMWVTFWWIYFTKFQVLGEGWQMQDVLGLWAIAAVSFGWTMGIFGNTLRLAGMIAQGQLDYYLSLPKNVLLHILVSRMDITAWGDMLFGTGVFVFFLRPSPDRIVLFLGLSLVAGVVFLSSSLVWQSLAFWLGNAEGLATQMWNAMILFGTYPAPLFTGFVRVVLFTVVPAAFVTYVPVQLLRDFDLRWLAAELAAAAFTLALAIWLFYRGLRRYESGSLMVMRT